MNALLEAAISHALENRPSFPARGKKPVTPHGFKNATLDPLKLAEYFGVESPGLQLAVLTGPDSGCAIVDLDGPAAEAELRELEARHGALPETFTAKTGHGKHLCYTIPRTSFLPTRKLAPHIDLKGANGYVIVPPSPYDDKGKHYEVALDAPWAPLPSWVFNADGAAKKETRNLCGKLGIGRRRPTLLSLVSSLRNRGMVDPEILAMLEIVNREKCEPLLEHSELVKLVAAYSDKNGRGRQLETSASVEIECFRAVQERPVQWLWEKKIALGTLALLVGMPGVGKSLVTDRISYHVSRGRPFPDGSPCELGDVIFLAAEDNPETTQKPRLLAAGCDVDRIHRVKSVRVNLADGETGESMFDLDRDIEKLQESLENIPTAKILWIDPVSAYFGRIDTHRDAEIRRVLTPLSELAARRNIAVGGIMHLKKSDATALLRVSGSIGFVAAARIVYGFGELPDGNGKRVMVPIKNNLAPLGDAIEYSIEADANNVPRIIWGAAINIGADEVLSGDPKNRATGPKQVEAEAWLEAVVRDGDEHFVLDIMEAAEKAGLSRRTVERAKLALGLKQGKRGRRWYWQLG